MTYLRIIAGIILAAGILMIVSARQLAILYEGPAYTMSDLGFVVGGMMLAGIGAVTLLITIVLGIARRR